MCIRDSPYWPFSSAALKPVLLITSRSLASFNFWSSYLITASPLSELTCASSTPSVALSALVTDAEHFAHFIPATLMVTVLVKAAAVITPRVRTRTPLTTRLVIRFSISLLSFQVIHQERLDLFLEFFAKKYA